MALKGKRWLLAAFIIALMIGAVAVAEDEKIGLAELSMLALEADARGQCDYAIACELEGDPEEAFKWFMKAADKELAEAEHQVGLAYANGIGVEENRTEALKWFYRAATQKFARAQFELGVAYAEGLGVVRDNRVAAEWFRLGADQGHAPSQCGLGWLYLDGIGVPQNHSQAYLWLSLATAKLTGEERGLCIEQRDKAMAALTPQERAEAQRLALEHDEMVREDEAGEEDLAESLRYLTEEEPEEAAHRRQLQLERMRMTHERKLQLEQMRQLRKIEEIRARERRRYWDKYYRDVD